jgi:hypothetical protein
VGGLQTVRKKITVKGRRKADEWQIDAGKVDLKVR